MLYGLFHLPIWGYIALTLLLTHITIVSVTVFLHRNQSHKSLTLHPIVSHFFRFWLWLTTGMVTKEWVAVHRKHHAMCESEHDPHSPQIYGIWRVLFFGALLYHDEARIKETLEKYGKGTPDDGIEHYLYSRFPTLGIFTMLAINLVFFGLIGGAIWLIQMIWIPFFAAGVINGVGHYLGYRNFDAPDASRNIVPFGILIGGEELHNNHHAFPNSAKLSVKWWEIDLGWMYISLLKYFRLATVYKIPPKLRYKLDKTQVDAETLGAVVNNRFEVMARYTKRVILPVLRQEKHHIQNINTKLFRRAKRALLRENLADDAGRSYLAMLLEHSPTLQQVYDYRLKLQTIWHQSTLNQNESLASLRDWCHKAETSGIQTLKKFVSQLKTYMPELNYSKG